MHWKNATSSRISMALSSVGTRANAFDSSVAACMNRCLRSSADSFAVWGVRMKSVALASRVSRCEGVPVKNTE